MTVIDADAHVEEGLDTWKYLDPAFHKQRPFTVQFPEDTVFGAHNAAWVIDYKIRLYGGTPTIMNRAQQKGATIPAQEISDVGERLEAMRAQGVDKQVVFPTIWQGPVAEDIDLEAALARSYNEYMAGQCGQSDGQLFYVAVVPFRQPAAAAEEVRRVKAMGSVAGLYVHGLEWDMPLTNPAFWPIYEAAESADLPLAIHTGNGASPTISRMLEGIPRPSGNAFPQSNPLGSGLVSGPYVLYAFSQLLGSSFMDDFPKLRLGFLETGSDWTVRLMKAIRRRRPDADQWLGERVFVSCAVDDELAYTIDKLGDDFIVTATDFPHGDAFREDHLAESLERRGDLSAASMDKILSANPLRLYHI
ncbi:MAG: amidohydrolase [Chloroflexi bacterium]|nr:amidohydrolase [Chloroflexota bacterium]